LVSCASAAAILGRVFYRRLTFRQSGPIRKSVTAKATSTSQHDFYNALTIDDLDVALAEHTLNLFVHLCEHVNDEGWPVDGLRVPLGPANATLASPKTFWRAADAPTVTLRVAFATKASTAQLLLQPDDNLTAGDWPQWGPERSKRPKPASPVVVPFALVGDGQGRSISIDLSAHSDYRGGMTHAIPLNHAGWSEPLIDAAEGDH
jgi:hypothetical protein